MVQRQLVILTSFSAEVVMWSSFNFWRPSGQHDHLCMYACLCFIYQLHQWNQCHSIIPHMSIVIVYVRLFSWWTQSYISFISMVRVVLYITGTVIIWMIEPNACLSMMSIVKMSLSKTVPKMAPCGIYVVYHRGSILWTVFPPSLLSYCRYTL